MRNFLRTGQKLDCSYLCYKNNKITTILLTFDTILLTFPFSRLKRTLSGEMIMKINLKQYGLYLLRWQLSTPILAIVLIWLSSTGKLFATVVANAIGGLIFFWVDRFIFTSKALRAHWEVRDNVQCRDCGISARGYRLVKTKNYDKTKAVPQFRCEGCSEKKTQQLRQTGVLV